MPSTPPRSRLSTWLAAVSFVALLGPLPAAGSVPDLVTTFDGTYQLTGQASAYTFQLEVEQQHGRRLRVSIFAVNQPEFQGRAKLLRDNATLTLHTKATGRGAARLRGMAQVDASGTTIAGTFVLHQKGLADRTGTFSVAR